MHQIIRAYQTLSPEGLPLALVSPSHVVARPLSLTQIDQVIRVYRNLEDAVAKRLP